MAENQQEKLSELESWIKTQVAANGIPLSATGVSKEVLDRWMEVERLKVEMEVRSKLREEQWNQQANSMKDSQNILLRAQEIALQRNFLQQENDLLRERLRQVDKSTKFSIEDELLKVCVRGAGKQIFGLDS